MWHATKHTPYGRAGGSADGGNYLAEAFIINNAAEAAAGEIIDQW